MRSRFNLLTFACLLTACSDAPTEPAALPLSIGPIRAERVGWDMVFSAYVRNPQRDTAVYNVSASSGGFNVVVRKAGVTEDDVWHADYLDFTLRSYQVSILPRDSIELTVRWFGVLTSGPHDVSAEFLTDNGKVMGRTARTQTFEIPPPPITIVQ
ncbi:MAG: hypothetical protein H7Z40_22880 [Phycisphaerae bacterium]|nr:hypothetical protein [Gemmatimonadaceae bacterium]